MDPEQDLAAFEAWLEIDREIAKLAGIARVRMSTMAAGHLDKLRGALAAEAQTYQEGAFEARLAEARRSSIA